MTGNERLGPPPVEALSDLSWARVERNLWARLDGSTTTVLHVPSRKRWLWIAAPALAAAAVVAIVIGTRGATPTLPIDDRPMRVVSGGAPSTISFGDAHVTLDAESAVVLSRDAASTAVLERGGAWFAVAERTRPFVVIAGDTVVRVIGTRFRVGRSEEHATVEVDRGLVDVTFQGTTVQIAAGRSWSSELPAIVTVTPPIAERGDDELVEDAATTAERPRKRTRPSTSRTKAADDPALPVVAIDLERLKYDRLTSSEVRDPAGALAGYLELSRGTGRWAEVALFAAGRLAADRGDDRAHTLLSIYVRRFPRGANANDARQLLERLKGAPR